MLQSKEIHFDTSNPGNRVLVLRDVSSGKKISLAFQKNCSTVEIEGDGRIRHLYDFYGREIRTDPYIKRIIRRVNYPRSFRRIDEAFLVKARDGDKYLARVKYPKARYCFDGQKEKYDLSAIDPAFDGTVKDDATPELDYIQDNIKVCDEHFFKGELSFIENYAQNKIYGKNRNDDHSIEHIWLTKTRLQRSWIEEKVSGYGFFIPTDNVPNRSASNSSYAASHTLLAYVVFNIRNFDKIKDQIETGSYYSQEYFLSKPRYHDGRITAKSYIFRDIATDIDFINSCRELFPDIFEKNDIPFYYA